MVTRRTFILHVISAAAATTLGARAAVAAPLPKVGATHPLAKALGYVTDTQKANAKDKDAVAKRFKFTGVQDCSNCVQYNATSGECLLFKGNAVEAKGWCKSWALKK